MEDHECWTKANRSSVVTRTEVSELPDGHPLRPKPEYLTHPSEAELQVAVSKGDTIWRLSVFYRTGFDEENSTNSLHLSQQAAIAAQKEYTVGQHFDPVPFLKPQSDSFDPNELSPETLISVMGRGEAPYSLVDKALEGADVYDQNHRLSEVVLTWLGKRGKASLEEEYGENWGAVAALEYCNKHFDPTSLATIAARVLVGEFVAKSDFDVGYASRELEVLYGGAEAIATSATQTRKRAGAGGGNTSRKRRLENLEAVMKEIEKLAGIVGLVREDRIVEQAFENAKASKSNFPKSKKSEEDYGVALRSDEPFKSRYDAVFRKDA
ncbi:hypothetical protein [Ruegeria arenilitoris]|uniref:hypothetical protein n=1 Tax=Ruegeria arenilitoris TaxID=1173585 RepID=UPI00147E7891|nr:hypothetical protein [Ruegeria arenilitoris]